MSFLTSNRVVRTALASAALLVLGTVAAPAAQAYNPLKKDIFVEMDYMPGLLASEEELDRITESFAQLPLRNPNGTTGINIHLEKERWLKSPP